MLNLENTNIIEFKEKLYKKYCEVFPKNKRKSYKLLKECFINESLSILKITLDGNIVGFMLINAIPECNYLQLDCLAIFDEYRNMGYGTRAMQILASISKGQYTGIFVEDLYQEKEVKFYLNLGFVKLDYSIKLFGNIYTPYILFLTETQESDIRILEDVYKIYVSYYGEKKMSKRWKLI